VYGGLTCGVIVIALLRASLFFWATMVAATRMHNSMVVRVLRAPLSFFHTNPAGRVLNRFSNDQVRWAANQGIVLTDVRTPVIVFSTLFIAFACVVSA
jgi:ABC-type multidrug transport system fused ATPase/permease subunit